VLAAGLALAGVACGDDPGGGSGDGSGDGSAGGDADVQVERVELDSPLAGELVAIGDVLLAGVRGEDGLVAGVQSSGDGGRSWEQVDLPSAPGEVYVDLERPVVVGGVAVVTGRDVVDQRGIAAPGGGIYVWTSTDGVAWHGARLADSGPRFGSAGVAAVGDVLLAGFTAGPPDYLASGTFALWRSTDDGASWQPAEVPDLGLGSGETARVSEAWTLPDGRLAATVSRSGGVTSGGGTSEGGAEPGGGASAGGDAESGAGSGSGSVAPGNSPPSTAAPGSAGGPDDPTVTGGAAAPSGGGESGAPGGGAAGASEGEAAPPPVLVSGDGGATWAASTCPTQDTDGGACRPPERAGDLLYRGNHVSVDGGRTWQPIAIAPPAEPDSLEPHIDGVVEEGDGGWLAAASVDVPSDVSYGFLLRSTDGVRWQQLLDPDPCRAEDIGRPNSSVSVPVRLGDRWLVAYSCLALSTPEVAELLAVPAGATGAEGEPVPIDDSQRDDVSYGEPVGLGDTVVVPELAEGRSAIVGLSLVAP
jgi:hypothetical protein